MSRGTIQFWSCTPLALPASCFIPFGSTNEANTIYIGPPKPIVYTHGSFAAHDMQHLIPTPIGRKKRDVSIFEFKDETRIYVIFPLFHVSSMMCTELKRR